MTFMDTLKGGQNVDTLVIGRNCSYVELKKMLHVGRVLVDGFGENQYAICGDRPVSLSVNGKTAPTWICSADRGCTVSLAPYLRPAADPALLDEKEPPTYSPGILDRKKNLCKVLIVQADGAVLILAEAYHVGPYLIRDDAAYQVADDTHPLSYRDGKKTLDLYVVDASRKTTLSLFMDGDPAVMPAGEIPADRTDSTGGFLAGSLYSMRTSPDMASRVWDSNILKYGWELQANKRMVAIAFLLGAGICFLGMMFLSLIL